MGRRMMFLVSEDWFFLSHRLPMARAAQAAGFEVLLACRCSGREAEIAALGVTVLPIRGIRGTLSPGRLLRDVAEIAALYRRHDPDLVHHVSIRMCLVGSLAAWRTRRERVINSFTGLGFLFTAPTVKARLIRAGVMGIFRLCLNRSGIVSIVQNDDDRAVIEGLRLTGGHRLEKVVGSGVDIDRFRPRPAPQGPVTAICVARMLADKGIRELAEAARLLKRRGSAVRVVLVGEVDAENPQSLSRDELDGWAAEGIVEWWGPRRDIDRVYAQGHIAVLPSYREGLPKSLLEGAASGLALVTTDVPGCRELVRDGQNGLLVPAGQAEPLADALARLETDAELRDRLGARARAQVEAGLSDQAVEDQMRRLYPG